MRKLLFLALFASCTTSSGTDTATVTSDLDLANGGETTADEAPMFGEEAEFDAAAIEPDAAYNDALASDPSVAAITASPTLDAHRVMIVWGKLPRDPGSTDSRDWSGSIAVSRGALVVGRTIQFEGNDHLLPRPDIQTVAFDSVTGPSIDGLVLRVLEPDNVIGTPVTLTYTSAASASATPPVQYQFDLAALEQGPVKIDAGNGYVMVAVELGEKSCNEGFMRGRWHQLAPNVGEYRGIVTDMVGLPIGHVRGIYGQTAAGDKVVFGKFIDHEGHFIGLINGTYGDGDISAKWLDKQGDHGSIAGMYFESSAVDGGGFFARYAESTCAALPAGN